MKRLQTGGRWLLLLLTLLGVGPVHAQSQQDQDFLSLLGQLRDVDFDQKQNVVEKLTQTGHSSVRAVLTAFLENRLYSRNDDMKVVIVKSADADPFDLIDPVTLKTTGKARTDSVTSISPDNDLRRFVRTTVARFSLSSPDVDIRLDAVANIMSSLDAEGLATLKERLPKETDSKVKKALDQAIALGDLDSPDAGTRLKAVGILGGTLNQDVRNRLALMVAKASDGSYAEPDATVRDAAARTLSAIDNWRSVYSGAQTLFFGLSLGSVLVLIAIGLAITFGVVGVINMAHGELMMLGAYTTFQVQTMMPNHIETSILVAIPAAFLVSGLVGVLMERSIIRFLYGRPLETLLATFGVSLILQQVVRSIYSANNRSVVTPDWMSGSMHVNDALSLTYNRLYIVLFTLLVFSVVLLVMKRTRIGLDIRAVSQNRSMAKAMGIRTEWVDAATFGLGSGIAGVAGVALSQLTNVGPNLGQSYIIDSFMVVVFGGVGNLWGSLIGGMSLGIVNSLLEPFAGAVLAKIFVLIALILFIQSRPRGLFPPTGRAAEDK